MSVYPPFSLYIALPASSSFHSPSLALLLRSGSSAIPPWPPSSRLPLLSSSLSTSSSSTSSLPVAVAEAKPVPHPTDPHPTEPHPTEPHPTEPQSGSQVPPGHAQARRLRQCSQRPDRRECGTATQGALLQPHRRAGRPRGRRVPLHRHQGQRTGHQHQPPHRPQPARQLLREERPHGLPVPVEVSAMTPSSLCSRSLLHPCSCWKAFLCDACGSALVFACEVPSFR
ncbi:hypothetical protein GW17_00053413 [Ensete ventricosum]|nr:hypothetical protein GW17_00053413 [Ensete ventricosum]